MKPSCSVCSSPEIALATAMIQADAGVDEIATATGLSAESLERHMVECVAALAEDSLLNSDERMRGLAAQIGAAALASGLQGDTKGQLAGLSLALRCEIESRRALENRLEKSKTVHADPENPATWPAEAQKLFAGFCDFVLKARCDAAK